MPADTVFSVRFHQPLVDCMHVELPDVRFTQLESFLGFRNDLRFLRWRWTRIAKECLDFATDAWVMDLIVAAYLPSPRKISRSFPQAQLAWYAERIEAAREQLTKRFADQHLLLTLARSVGMSPFQFARIFRELTGFAPHQYLLKVRYREALHMLLIACDAVMGRNQPIAIDGDHGDHRRLVRRPRFCHQRGAVRRQLVGFGHRHAVLNRCPFADERFHLRERGRAPGRRCVLVLRVRCDCDREQDCDCRQMLPTFFHLLYSSSRSAVSCDGPLRLSTSCRCRKTSRPANGTTRL